MKVIYILATLLLLTSCSDPTSPELLQAEFKIIKSETTTEPFLGVYFTSIDYSVKNTGNIDIASYEGFFTITLTDESRVTESHEGGFVGVGSEKFLQVSYLEGQISTSAIISDWNLSR